MGSARRYRFGPLEERTLLGPLRAGQLICLGAGAALGMGAMYGVGGIVGLAVALACAGAAAAAILVPIDGRTAEEWAPVALGWALRGRRARAGYRSSAPAAGVALDEEGELRHELSLPPALGGLELLEVPYGRGEIGVMRDRRANTYTAVLSVRGGAFSLRDAAEQERKLDAWGSVLASCGRDGSPVSRLQWIERTLPAQADELAGHLQASRDPTVPIDSTPVRSYIELIESATPAAGEHEVLIAIQIDQRRGARELRRLGGGEQAACELLAREAESFAERLTLAEVSVLGILTPHHYAALIRDAFDPFGRNLRARAALREPGRAGAEPTLMGPLADQTSWSTYRTDSAVHATYWISAWPRTDVGPSFLMPLLMQTTALRTVSVTIEPVPYSVAMRRAEAASTAQVAEEMQRERQGFLTTAQIRRRQQATARREEELADGHALLRWVGMVTVSDRTEEDLQRSAPTVEHSAAQARLELQRLYGEQDTAFAATLPLCRGLR